MIQDDASPAAVAAAARTEVFDFFAVSVAPAVGSTNFVRIWNRAIVVLGHSDSKVQAHVSSSKAGKSFFSETVDHLPA
jgi:hypothetical protein